MDLTGTFHPATFKLGMLSQIAKEVPLYSQSVNTWMHVEGPEVGTGLAPAPAPSNPPVGSGNFPEPDFGSLKSPVEI
jgi:hypothetical protein